jgi:hypothetical protein
MKERIQKLSKVMRKKESNDRRLSKNSYRAKKNERFRFGYGIIGVWISS